MKRKHESPLVFLGAVSVVAFVAMLSPLAGCKKDEPTRWDQASSAAKAPTPPPDAPAVPKTEGGALNKFFPADGTDGTKRVFTQEKTGFAEARLSREGKDVATLSISDAVNDDAVKAKFTGVADSFKGNPIVTVGKNQTAVLVKNKYQVKVSSQSLDADARKAWLDKFDLSGLSAL